MPCIGISVLGRSSLAVIAERRQREQIFFNSRKGIVAISIRTGVDIVPTYFLGQSQVGLASWQLETH